MRTVGTKDCGGCRYWSEMIAWAGGGTDNETGALEALCLAAGGPHSGKYTTQRMTCVLHAPGHTIDEPGVNSDGVFVSEI